MTPLLLDTNAYFRLAKSFHPLLGKVLPASGSTPARVLRVISEVDREFEANTALMSKFHWVAEAPYQHNRKQNILGLTGKQPTLIADKRKFIEFGVRMSRAEFKAKKVSPPSPTDCLVLAYGEVLGIDVVSDDGGMVYTASTVMGLKCGVQGSLDVLHALLQSNQITLAQIKSAARFLDYEHDLPGSWRRDSMKLFGQKLP